MKFLIRVRHTFLKHRYGLTLAAFLTAAALTGVACVGFMRAFEFVLDHRLDFASIGPWCWLTTPLFFLISVELIRRVAPYAAGTGIPQTVFSAEHLTPSTEQSLTPLFSWKTMLVKVFALLIALWVGASTGREGPTVHIATCIFLFILFLFRPLGLKIDLRSAVVAGGAAGLAAAFNTPLAGVTFAIEELTSDYFGSTKDFVLVAIIIAAIAAQSLTGEYTYFGRLSEPLPIPLLATLIIGCAGGMVGAIFSTLIVKGQAFFSRFHRHPKFRYVIPIILPVVMLALAAVAKVDILGPGNKAAQTLMEDNYGQWSLTFPFLKISSTLLTYWSGVAGGIFAPCLSIGASLGANIGYWMSIPIATCALIGMAAFLSGTIQAPITAFVIIFEMTGHHQMLLPIMLASLLAFMTAHLLGAKHLYKTLALSYQDLLPQGEYPGKYKDKSG